MINIEIYFNFNVIDSKVLGAKYLPTNSIFFKEPYFSLYLSSKSNKDFYGLYITTLSCEQFLNPSNPLIFL